MVYLSHHFLWTLTKNIFDLPFNMFIRVQLLYNAVLVSSVQQSGSAVCVSISPPFWASLPPPPSHTLKKLTAAVLKMVSYSVRQLFLYMCNSWRLLFSLFFIFWLLCFSGWTELPLIVVLNSLLWRCRRDSFWSDEGFGEAVCSLKQDSKGWTTKMDHFRTLANIQSHWKNWKPPKINCQAPMKQWDLWSVVLFIWLGRVLVAGRRIISLPIRSLVVAWELSFASRGILVPWPGMEPRSPALGVWSLSHWTTGDMPVKF